MDFERQFSQNQLPTLAKDLIHYFGNNGLWLFYGEMGSGKTTLIRQLALELGVKDEISSPTFSIVNEYKMSNGKPLFHFDFYRIDNIEEALDLDLPYYFESDALCLVEWPEKISKLLLDFEVQLFLTPLSPDIRLLKAKKHGTTNH